MPSHNENNIDRTTDLETLLAAYRALPTDELVAESLLLTEDSDVGPRLAGAAVFGFTRSAQYVDTARGLMESVVLNARQIEWHMEAYSVILDGIGDAYNGSPLAQNSETKAATHQRGAIAINLRAEVQWHLYATCLDRAWHFMRNSFEHFQPSFKVKREQQEYIDTIRAFRNHLEHRDKAISDITSRDWASMARSGENLYEIGYRRDNRNRILFKPVTGQFQGQLLKIPISQEGFLQFKNIIAYTYESLIHSALDRLRRHFSEHPELMPKIEEVGTMSREYIEIVK